MSKLYVRARYSKTGEVTTDLTGYINTKSLSFVSDDKKTYKIKKTFNKYHYQDKIIFASEEGKIEEEWILTLIPTEKILNSMGVKHIDIEESEDDEDNDDESEEESSEDEDDDYVPNESEEDLLEEEEEFSDED
jgi:hypothetical protein